MLGTDNCPAGSISEDPSFLYMSAGSVWGGANTAHGPAIGEASNTVEAHKLVCGRVNATVPLGAFRGRSFPHLVGRISARKSGRP